MANIAISYRWAEPSKLYGRIYDRLVVRYGRDAVFMDRYDVGGGQNITEVVHSKFRSADVIVALIGKNWIAERDGHAHIFDDNDPVRRELEVGFDAHVPLCPVLIDGAEMPAAAQLPPSLRELREILAVRVNDDDFEHHIDVLIRAIDRILGPKAPPAAVVPPSGEVTFLFTDIAEYGERWDAHETAMTAAIQRHDALAQAVLATDRGYRFRPEPGKVCAAFAQARDALAAALSFQRVLAGEDFSAVDGLTARMALHTGRAEFADGVYFGQTVNRAERLLEIACGGQVLLSGATHELALAAPSPLAGFEDLGEHRLRDLARPEQVYQLVAAGMRANFPPPKSLSSLPNNLPNGPLTSFVGRDAEVAAITELLRNNRLVTVVGTGGVGKSRVALQVAANLLDGRGDGVWFVELETLRDGNLVASTIANAIGAKPLSRPDQVAELVEVLKTKRMLLVLNTCEHLRDDVAATVSAILEGTGGVDVLATSREPLGTMAENRYLIPTLAFPDEAQAPNLTVESALRYGAITLFVNRAVSALNTFELTGTNVQFVAEIVRRLDGIALATELAAARVGTINVGDLAKRLDNRFRVLTGGSRDAPPKQQTLRATIDWSYDLLDEREKMLFQRVAVFVDGFSMDAAVAVCCDETFDEYDLLDVLTSLVNKSLVVAELTAESTRYRLLQSTRAYAFERLTAASERARTATRHLEWVSALVQRAVQRDDMTLREDAFEALAADLGNVREAIAWARASGDVGAGAAIVAAVCGRAMFGFGSIAEWSSEVERSIAALPADRHTLLSALHGWSSMIELCTGGLEPALHAAELAVSEARVCTDAFSLASALILLGRALVFLNRYGEAEAALAESEEIAGPQRSARLFARHYDARGTLAFFLKHYDDALDMYGRVVKKYRDLGAPIRPFYFNNVAEVEYARGNTTQAIAVAREGLQSGGGPYDRELLLVNLAAYLLAVDDIAGAREAAQGGLMLLETTQPGSVMCAYPIVQLALIAAIDGDVARAARLRGYTERRMAETGSVRLPTEDATYRRLGAVLDAKLAPDQLERYGAEGRNLDPQQARDLAMGRDYPGP